MSRVFVAGSINMDVVATADRHPRIGETVAGKEILYFPGGKGANQAVSAAKLGAGTILVGRLGMDAFGRDLKAFLAGLGIDVSLVRETQEAHTGTAIITVANSDNTIVVIPGANALVTPDDVASVPFAHGDIAVSQFEIPLPAIRAFFKRARDAGATTILNPAPAVEVGRELLDLVDILILNETELSLLATRELLDTRDHTQLIEAANHLRGKTDKIVCVTLGEHGVLALVDGKPLVIPGRSVKAVDTTGAGDCFVGAVAASLADGKPIRRALGYANVAASISVQRIGAAPSMPTMAEISAVLREERIS
jgi:ribokinase